AARQEEHWLPEAAVRRLCGDEVLLAAHRAMLPPTRRRRIDPLNPAQVLARVKLEEAETLDEAVAALERRELAAALGDPAALELFVNLFCAEQAQLQPHADHPQLPRAA